MPSRPRPSKVTKQNGSTRNRKPSSGTVQQELEHRYVVANGNTNGHGLIDRVSLGHQMALPLRQTSPFPRVGGSSDVPDNFSFAPQPNPYPVLGPPQYSTAADLARSKYGADVKLDSALCKKLGAEEAKRPPTQRRADQKLNIDRRSNMEAFVAHVTGQVVNRPCKNCYKGHGPWTQCVVYEGQMCGSCTNCWYNASGSRCTFHGIGTGSPPPAAMPPSGVPANGSDETGGGNLPYYTSPKDDAKVIPDWATPHRDNESNDSSQNHSHASEPLPTQPPAYMAYPPPAQSMPHQGLAGMGIMAGGGGGQDAAASVASWMACEPTRRLIRQAMDDVAMLSRRDRYIARIETAAEELGMRIAEYNEYMKTPEGVADLQHFQEAAAANMMPPGHAHDARMDTTMETESIHGDSSMA
ncbi:hypothetical protein ISF_01910 [Cordyceps fumosorosea ARSEF 2679]|uniref:Uncharacterized protein n=1 Tax=Cordyceps fumosorosea (strain ARSEF 2679) TaxID=1081104 RepID=A0A162MVT6_CORFA|nr:hypothetical protein ISF_01910 [Cordyceps fumosorosea ARSEF 2679]OAA71359.1 hypothetical protein ISF_01910 [Cordyceps fumosorosea ARSEF 2679]